MSLSYGRALANPGPRRQVMRLTTLHQVLIVGAIALGSIYALRSAVMFARAGQQQQLGLAALGVAMAVASLFYLRRFRRKLRAAQVEPTAEAS